MKLSVVVVFSSPITHCLSPSLCWSFNHGKQELDCSLFGLAVHFVEGLSICQPVFFSLDVFLFPCAIFLGEEL